MCGARAMYYSERLLVRGERLLVQDVTTKVSRVYSVIGLREQMIVIHIRKSNIANHISQDWIGKKIIW